MADGGYVMKFDGKEIYRCYTVSFDYDANEYKVNEEDPKLIPKGVKAIVLEVERSSKVPTSNA